LRICITDDGIGTSAQTVQRRQEEGHWGIAGMRERAKKLGGKLTITSQPLQGTTITLRVPRHCLL
jgi:signal transduction histidine kinase